MMVPCICHPRANIIFKYSFGIIQLNQSLMVWVANRKIESGEKQSTDTINRNMKEYNANIYPNSFEHNFLKDDYGAHSEILF